MVVPKKYNFKDVEEKWMEIWERDGIYKFDTKSKAKIFSIDTPPPTVSGKMHMGHAFGNSQQDFIARYKRMRGFNVLQPFGTDDNGLPTQTLIQKIKKVNARKMDRKEFRKLCLDTINKELKPKYTSDWKRLGISCDFTVKYSTIDPHCQRISQKSFIDLYKAGREYRVEAAAMHCPKCMTAISQVECEDKEISSSFNDIVFMVGKEKLTIATTRPELLPACVAVFYHPDDKRFKKYKGKKAKVPLFDFEVPILPDERADPEKGSGIVMCCTFGDSTDVEWQKAHNLPIKEAIGKDGRMTKLADKYKGMKIEEARKEIIKEMKEKKLLLKQEPITHAVNVHERCGTPIEFIHSKQWFIKYLDLKDDFLKLGNKVKWHPAHMKNRFDNWVGGLQWDWCISRQIYFGIPFPVWYCKKCEDVILANEKDLPVDPLEDKAPISKCPKCGGKEFIGETDIINTWATSSLTPTIVKELFVKDKIYKELDKKPMDFRPQGHDIISFWLFNTIVKSKLHFNMVPWTDCFINGWMLDPHGKKMSKSKGNVIEPQGMIDKYGADALRFMSSACRLGDDFPFQEKELVTGGKISTKLWNASKFCFIHLKDYKPKKVKLEAFDKWLLSKLHKVIKKSTDSFEEFEFSYSKAAVEYFFWHNLCDNYLEVVKDRLYNPDTRGDVERESGQYVLYQSLLDVLKLFAPIMPFITEEIHNTYFDEKNSIHKTTWPKYDSKLVFEKEEEIGDRLIEVIAEVRKLKSENQISLKEPVKELVLDIEESEVKEFLDDLKAVTKAEKISFGKKLSIKL
ncbi:valine--tRNA ligase [archaeon]|jgi:valyl-tRNA synthetase|nr:valine--tRNA ligase [archaeon]MBT4396940.1 valine--tRNA ligase [archaeon]MBT4440931.1 valine--tRNA ligase [archaeon]